MRPPTVAVSSEAVFTAAVHLLSNTYRREENEKVLVKFPRAAEAEGLLYVKEEYLRSSMDAITEKYGDFRTYLSAEYGVTGEEIALFRERYLEK